MKALNRRAVMALGWTSTMAWMLASTAVTAAEFRGRPGTTATYRLAALQVDDETDIPSASDVEPEMESEAEPMPPAKAAPARKPATSAKPRVPMAPPVVVPYQGGLNSGPMTFDPQTLGSMHQQGGPCSDGYCEACPPAGHHGLFCNGAWGSLEYLLWWRDSRSTPPLVTTTTTIVNQDVDGELGQANTRVLLGSGQYNDHLQPGGRIDLGYWLDPCQSWGIGMRFAALGDDDLNYIAGSAVNPVLTVPFFNLDPAVNAQDTLVVAHPLDNTSGSIQVLGHNEVNLGDVYVRLVGARSDRYRVDIIGGYEFSNILDDMTLRTSTTSGQTDIVVRDRFRAKNSYQGGVIGLMSQYDRGPWSVNLLGKVGLVNAEQTVIIDGLTTIGGTPQSLTGLFAQTSNSATITRNRFAAIPELTANWVYKIGRANLTVGYSAIYWSNTARAGDQINPMVDPTQATARPPRQIVSDNYFVHGVNFGLAWQY